CLKPIYIFQSGGLQPADFLILCLFLCLVFLTKYKNLKRNIPISIPLQKMIIYTSIFFCWIFIMNAIYFFIYNDTSFLKPNFYYIYNLIVLVVVYLYYLIYGNILFAVIKVSTVLTLYIQFTLYVI